MHVDFDSGRAWRSADFLGPVGPRAPAIVWPRRNVVLMGARWVSGGVIALAAGANGLKTRSDSTEPSRRTRRSDANSWFAFPGELG
jgi:hypothetical protein